MVLDDDTVVAPSGCLRPPLDSSPSGPSSPARAFPDLVGDLVATTETGLSVMLAVWWRDGKYWWG